MADGRRGRLEWAACKTATIALVQIAGLLDALETHAYHRKRVPKMTHEPHDMDDAKLETVAERAMESAALILVSVLKDAGIRAIATGGFTAGFRAEAPGMVKVQTFEADAERARQVIAEIRELPEDAIANDDIATEEVGEDPADASTDASGPQA